MVAEEIIATPRSGAGLASDAGDERRRNASVVFKNANRAIHANATEAQSSSESSSALESLHTPKAPPFEKGADTDDNADTDADADTDDNADSDTDDNATEEGDNDVSGGFIGIEDRWTPQPAFSITAGHGPLDLKKELTPLLTSNDCYLGMVDFFQHSDERLSAARLSVATESSSHPADIRSLLAQPWVYAGGGLGNMDECLSLNTDRSAEDPLVHVCLAGGTSRDSLTFASACVVAACSAEDVYADDFPERVASAGFKSGVGTETILNNNSTGYDRMNKKYDVAYRELLSEYVTLHKRMNKIGEFLNTGWVCGEYVVDWQPFPSLVWCGAMVLCTLFTFLGTRRRRSPTDGKGNGEDFQPLSASKLSVYQQRCCDLELDRKQDYQHNNYSNGRSSPSTSLESLNPSFTSISSSSSTSSATREHEGGVERFPWFWSAWDLKSHLKRLTHQRIETACLDGLKVGSILWVIGAHILAIQISTGAGYLNPKDFLPPSGITTTFFGQLLFSSRYAVDTFLCISGYLAAYVLQRKLKLTTKTEKSTRSRLRSQSLGFFKIVAVIFFRVIRILPLYLCCLGFWMFLAPHMGSGPFWYQWEHFLEPCRQFWWTNLLFVNNFLPWGAPTEANCFYHSWYLAVDVQLFCLFAPWLVLVYQSSPTRARRVTLALWLASVVGTACLAYTQGWSVNSFDGISVLLFDVEGYAKPHVRAQSYLAGIFVAFWPRRQKSSTLRSKGRLAPSDFADNWAMVLVVSGLATLSFVTVTGAYARRACTFEESPLAGDDCGSLWSPSANFLYAAFGRAVWSVCIALLLHLCLLGEEESNGESIGRNGKKDREDECRGVSLTKIVQNFLGWRLWTPLAHLSFGAYLIHPIVIYVWFLGGREKVTFRLFTFFMEFCSITVVTFVASFAVTILVEFPFGILLKPPSQGIRRKTMIASQVEATNTTRNYDDAEMASLLDQSPSVSPSLPHSKSQLYGSLQQGRQ